MKTLKLTLLAASAACVFTFPAMVEAQAPAPAPAPAAATAEPEPPAANIEAAKKLVDVMELKEQMSAGFNAMMPMIEQMATQFRLDDAGKAEMVGIYKDWFEKDLDHAKMYNDIVKIYAGVFTVEELNGLRDFYMTPLGKKSVKTLPEITQKSAQLGMQEAAAKEQQLMSRLKPFLESKLGGLRGPGAGAKPE